MKFRESFRGYNKEDVNSYIEQMNIKFSRRESELLAMIPDNAGSDDGDKDRSEADQISAVNEELRQRNAILDSELSVAKGEIEKLRAELAEVSEKNAGRGDDSAENEAVTGERLGNLLIIANENAEKIVRDAKEEASRIISEANLRASSIEYEVAREKKRATDEFSKQIAELSKEYLAECTDIFAETSVRINESAKRLTSDADRLSAV